MEKTEDLEMQDEKTAFLSGPPRSGELSPFAAKLATETFVWLASIVVFGSTAEYANTTNNCSALCGYAVATGVISFIFTSMILIGHYLTWTNKIDRRGWFTSAAESRFMIALVVWWTPGVAGISAVQKSDAGGVLQHASGVGIFFGWLAFFGSIFGAYKAFHASKEEQKSLHYAQQMSIHAEEEFANFS